MPIHLAITRRTRPGREAEFEQSLREFFQSSFSREGVLGVSLLTPLPGGDSREYGILRTFTGPAEREAFYQSEEYAAWEKRVEHLVDGPPVHRELTGLEAWFRSSSPPPRWKMATATFLGVFPVGMALNLTLMPLIQSWPFLLKSALFNLCVVALLTWAVMPLVTRLLHRWLHPSKQKTPPP